jgi:hypothetical protein
MKKNARRKGRTDNRDTMRPEYDFSRAVRGVTAARYAQGTNVVVTIRTFSTCFRTARL